MKLTLAIAVLGLPVALAASLGLGARGASADAVATNVTVGSSPRVVAIAPNHRVFVANRLSNSLSVIDPGSDTVINTITVSRPGALHIGTDGRVYVPDHDRTGSTLTVIDSNSYAATTVSTGGLWPSAVDTSADNSRVVVTNELSNSVAVFDGSLNLLTNPPLAVGAKPHTVVVNPAGTKAYVARQGDLAADPGGIVVIDLASFATKNITVGSQPTSLDFVGSTLFVGNSGSSNVSLIDTTSDTVTKTVPTEGAPHGIAETPDRSKVFVANEAAGTVTVLSGTGDVLAASIPVGLRPQRIHITSDGRRAYVPNEGSDSVSVIDVGTLAVVQTLDSAAGIGAAPTSLQTLGSSKVYVADKSSNAVTVVNVQEAAPATATPPSTSTPIPSATAASTETAVAPATLAPGETPPPADTPAGVSASGEAPGGGQGGDVSAQDATATQAASVLGATAQPGSATPGASPTARAQATMMSVGIIAQSTSEAAAAPDVVDASSSGGAPSWIWLATALAVLGVAGGGGYLGRARIKLYLSRIRR